MQAPLVETMITHASCEGWRTGARITRSIPNRADILFKKSIKDIQLRYV